MEQSSPLRCSPCSICLHPSCCDGPTLPSVHSALPTTTEDSKTMNTSSLAQAPHLPLSSLPLKHQRQVKGLSLYLLEGTSHCCSPGSALLLRSKAGCAQSCLFAHLALPAAAARPWLWAQTIAGHQNISQETLVSCPLRKQLIIVCLFETGMLQRRKCQSTRSIRHK